MKTLALAAFAALGASVLIPAVRADDLDNKTTIKVNETILIPGRTLTPGTYVMKLLPSFTNRNIVQIYNEDQSRLQATILAVNNHRLEPKDKTVLTYWETPSGSPPALRAWFAPGDNYGQEFAYPKKIADELARANNNARVPTYADDAQVDSSPKLLENIAVTNTEEDIDAPRGQSPARVEQSAAPARPNTVFAQETPVNRAPSEEILLAQNQPPAPPVAPNPAADELPQTASSLGWVLAIGLMMLSTAALVSYSRKA